MLFVHLCICVLRLIALRLLRIQIITTICFALHLEQLSTRRSSFSCVLFGFFVVAVTGLFILNSNKFILSLFDLIYNYHSHFKNCRSALTSICILCCCFSFVFLFRLESIHVRDDDGEYEGRRAISSCMWNRWHKTCDGHVAKGTDVDRFQGRSIES
jgi:hypothetical protein